MLRAMWPIRLARRCDAVCRMSAAAIAELAAIFSASFPVDLARVDSANKRRGTGFSYLGRVRQQAHHSLHHRACGGVRDTPMHGQSVARLQSRLVQAL